MPQHAVSSISAISGVGGSTLTITGTEFGTLQGPSIVVLGDKQCDVTSWSDTSIVVTIPKALPNITHHLAVLIRYQAFGGAFQKTG